MSKKEGFEKQTDVSPLKVELTILSRPSTAPATGSTRSSIKLPSPSISVREYNLACSYCSNFDNMTHQDWMELAVIEKLHNDGLMSDDEFTVRRAEIRSRLPRGQRKNKKKK